MLFVYGAARLNTITNINRSIHHGVKNRLHWLACLRYVTASLLKTGHVAEW
jgi:hypothetical protein